MSGFLFPLEVKPHIDKADQGNRAVPTPGQPGEPQISTAQ